MKSPEIVRSTPWWLLLVLLVTFSLAVGSFGYLLLVYRPQTDERISALTTAGAQQQAAAVARGEPTVGPPIASISAGKATNLPTDEAPVTPAPTYVESARPTQEQVNAGIRAWFKLNPPKWPITTAELTTKVSAFVTSYIRAHPPAPGKTGPSGAPCSVKANPDCKGEKGDTGVPGQDAPSPSEQQVTQVVSELMPAALADYFIAHPPPSGAQGSPGTDGTNGTNGTDGAPGSPGQDAPTIVSHDVEPVGDGMCVDTLHMSDGTDKPSDPYPCPAPATSTNPPSTIPTPTPTGSPS